MKHISKFDGYEYEITYSVDYEGNKVLSDDIILIWRDAPCGIGNAFLQNIPPRTLVGWYYGEYDEAIVEDYIKDYWKKQLAESEVRAPKKPKTLDLPIAYLHVIQACLQTIQKYDLYKLLDCYDGNKDREFLDALKLDVDYVLKGICEPLDELDKDIKIILED